MCEIIAVWITGAFAYILGALGPIWVGSRSWAPWALYELGPRPGVLGAQPENLFQEKRRDNHFKMITDLSESLV